MEIVIEILRAQNEALQRKIIEINEMKNNEQQQHFITVFITISYFNYKNKRKLVDLIKIEYT
jgi:hypothetical protein